MNVRIKADNRDQQWFFERMIEYTPPRISGTEEQLAELGIEILGQPSLDSGWTYEFTDVRIPADKIYEVEIDQEGASEDYYCDMFFAGGVTFAYVDLRDWEIMK